MSIIIPSNSIVSGGFSVANSCRFNSGSSDNLQKTPSGDGNKKTFTVSTWVKRSNLGSHKSIWSAGQYQSTAMVQVFFESDDTIHVSQFNAGGGQQARLTTNRLFRDVSAWYHIVAVWDTTQGTDTNRLKLYVNGVQETSFSTAAYPSQNDNTGANTSSIPITIGNRHGNSLFFSGYQCECVLLDGTAAAITDLGEFDEDSGIWKPIDVSGLTFGTNGYYLDFEDSANLGNDVNGGTDFTENNLTAIDQSTDTCTNNFCTWNSLDKFYSSATFAFGNTTVVTPNASLTYATGTVGLSNGRWYFEVQPFDPSDFNNIGIVDHVSTSNSSSAGELHFQPRGYAYRQPGDVYNNNSSVSGSWAGYSAGVTIGVFVDLEDNKIYWSRNGVMQNSGTGVAITASASTDTGFYFPAVGDYVTNDDTTFRTNFGGSSSFAISSGVTDDNGYGTFEYTPSVTVDSTAKKFYAICTKNLAEYG